MSDPTNPPAAYASPEDVRELINQVRALQEQYEQHALRLKNIEDVTLKLVQDMHSRVREVEYSLFGVNDRGGFMRDTEIQIARHQAGLEETSKFITESRHDRATTAHAIQTLIATNQNHVGDRLLDKKKLDAINTKLSQWGGVLAFLSVTVPILVVLVLHFWTQK